MNEYVIRGVRYEESEDRRIRTCTSGDSFTTTCDNINEVLDLLNEYNINPLIEITGIYKKIGDINEYL